MTQTDSSSSQKQKSPYGFWIKLSIFVTVVAAVAVGWMLFRQELTLERLAERETEFRQYQNDYPILVYVVAFLIYVGVTGLSLPGAAVLSMVFAWYFGFWRGLVLVSFASTTGATLAFLLSRYLFRDWIEARFGARLTKFNDALEREGPFFLFSLRLIPAVPFFVINVVMGLTPIRVRTFWWVSQIGMLPGTAVYVYAGSSFPSLEQLSKHGAGGIFTWQVITAFVLLGLFPLVVRFAMKWIKPRGVEESSPVKPNEKSK